jgi:hypothetical protein
MFHRNPKSQNTTSVSKCTSRLVVAACLSTVSLHTGIIRAQPAGAPPASATSTNAPSPTSASAATADPATRVMAREFATRGAEAFDRGAFALALDDFNRAAALLDAPTIAIMQARTLVKLGRWIEGLDRYQQTARRLPSPTDPAPYHEAVHQAALEGESLRQQLPQLTLIVDPTIQSQVSVELDGQTLPALLLNTSRPVDPGTHKLKASNNGVPFLERSLESAAGQHAEIRISLPASPKTTTPPPGPVPASNQLGQTPIEQGSDPNWPLIGVAAIGGMGALGVALTTVLGSSADATLNKECPDRASCPGDQKGNIQLLETAQTLFYISSAMFVIGGGLTAYLLLTSEGNGDSQTRISVSPIGAQLTTMF